MAEDVKENEMQGGVPAKVRALDRDGNSIVTDIGEIPIPVIVVATDTVGSVVPSGISKSCILYIQNVTNSLEVSIAMFSSGSIYPIVERGEIDFSESNPSKQISVYAVNGTVCIRLNRVVSMRRINIWKISVLS